MLPAAAQAFARSRGISAGEPIAQLPAEVSEATTERYVEYSVGGGGGVTSIGFELFAASLASVPADPRMLAEIHFLKGMQLPEGYWRGGGNRPPLTFDDFTPTAYVIRALSTTAAVDADTNAQIDRARAAADRRRRERRTRIPGARPRLGEGWPRAIDSAVRGLQDCSDRMAAGRSCELSTDACHRQPTQMYEGGVAVTSASTRRG
jgi:hypothetical protein